MSSTSKATPYFEEVIHLVADFLDTLGYEQYSVPLRKMHPLPKWVKKDNPLFQKGLSQIVKAYARSKSTINDYFIKRQQPIEEKEENKINNKSKQLFSKFDPPRKLEEITEIKIQKIKKRQTPVEKEEEYVLDSDSFVLEKSKIEVVQNKRNNKKIQQETKGTNGFHQRQKFVQKTTFSRINLAQIKQIPLQLKDNSFEAKCRFGTGGDNWGAGGYQKLRNLKGQQFKKMKGKLKNKTSLGGSLNQSVINSISLV